MKWKYVVKIVEEKKYVKGIEICYKKENRLKEWEYVEEVEWVAKANKKVCQ